MESFEGVVEHSGFIKAVFFCIPVLGNGTGGRIGKVTATIGDIS